jgi:hypothetical protein
MPPQVNPCGSGTRPIANQTCDQAEEAKSKEPEKKPAQQQSETSKNDGPKPYRATSKEASNRKVELSTQATAQQAALNGKLDRKAAKSENGAPATTIEDAVLRLESVSKQTERLLDEHQRAQRQRADTALHLLESVTKQTERLLELEKAKIGVNVKTSGEARK